MDMETLAAAEAAIGCFEEVDWRDGRLSVAGWMMAPGNPIDRIRLHIGGEPADSAFPLTRPDVQVAYRWIPHAGRSGFRFRSVCLAPEGRMDLFGDRKGRAVCRMSAFYESDPASERLIAPARLTQRSTGVFGRQHRLQGLRIFTDFHDQILRFRDHEGPINLLDWGCGSGRLAAPMIHILKAKVTGADVDAEAIEWCGRHLPEGTFDVVGCEPPLPYSDRSFDVAVACSVFTHLGEQRQRPWIEELFRVIRPGGILLASVHGEFAHQMHLNSVRGLRRLRRLAGLAKRRLTGIVDGDRDPAFDGITPSGYYRTVYQTRDNTIRRWTGLFKCLDYIERGVDGFQDLVVLQAVSRRGSDPS